MERREVKKKCRCGATLRMPEDDHSAEACAICGVAHPNARLELLLCPRCAETYKLDAGDLRVLTPLEFESLPEPVINFIISRIPAEAGPYVPAYMQTILDLVDASAEWVRLNQGMIVVLNLPPAERYLALSLTEAIPRLAAGSGLAHDYLTFIDSKTGHRATLTQLTHLVREMTTKLNLSAGGQA